ncbi:MAG: ABC transporter [Firmicutes bacterium HGW-Firmicutes-8]|nr:MAG: ABC transporter [Firmicutes bacterium HGW-Firmicutes-8]
MENLLKIDNIRFTIGVNTGRVEVSGLLEEGGVLNICGPSGSGKTTLLRILAKLKETGGGSVFLQGKPWTDFSPSGWRRKVYYLAQKPAIFDGTVEENLKKPFELAAVKTDLRFDLDRAARLMERLYLPQELLTRDARTLSGGESSRVALVRALLVEPSVLLLDEPLAALDRTAASAVIELIAEWLEETGGRGAALVSHTGDIGGLSCCSILDLGGKEGDLSE